MKSTEKKQVMDALDRIVDKVLAYEPKERKKQNKEKKKPRKEK